MIRLADPDIRPDDIRRAVRCIRSGNLVQGRYVGQFEKALAEFSGISHCAAVSSGTAALHVALMALGIGPGDAVLVPGFTFPATANVVERVGARSIVCDVDADSYVLNPDRVRETLASRPAGSIAALIVVHEFGYPADMPAIASVAREFGVKLVEDAACAMGTSAGGAHPGKYSDVACLSFHPRKALTTGEGGALLSENAELMRRIRELRNHGMRIDGGVREFVDAGLNYRLTDFQAALGVGQVTRFADELAKRRLLAARYLQQLQSEANLLLPQPHPGHSWQTFMAVLDGTVDRARVIAGLRERGIESGPGAQALHCLDYFRRKYGFADADFPNAAKLYRQGLALPLHGKLDARAVDRVCEALRACLAEQRQEEASHGRLQPNVYNSAPDGRIK